MVRRLHAHHLIRLILLLAVIGGLGEIVARHVLGLGTPPLYVLHPSIEYMFNPNQDVYRFGNRFIVNQFGMRTEPFTLKKRQEEFRAMVFGDSVLNGGYLTDQANLATSLLKATVTHAGYEHVVIGNISAGSWGPGNWLAYAKEYGFFDADVVVLVVSSHDASDNPTFTPLNKNTHPMDRPVSALLEGMERYVPRYLPSFDSGKKTVEPDRFEATGEQEVKQGLKDLREFLELARSRVRDVLVFQHLEQSELETNSPKAGFFQIKDLCTRLGIKVVSLRDYYVRAKDRGLGPYRDNIHLNEVGQSLLAEAMEENIPFARTGH